MDLGELEGKLSPSILSRVDEPLFRRRGVELWLKRDDLLHPIISGNKWRKLKYVLQHALALRSKRIISMGGAYSNHLHALAYAGKCLGLATAAFIRGEARNNLNPTLSDLKAWGMRLNYLSRTEYRELRAYKDHHCLPDLQEGDYWLPEGGAGALALPGVGEIVAEIDSTFDVLVVPCGTGTTLAGLIKAVPDTVQVLGISALKGADFLYREVAELAPEASPGNWRIELDYHFGGFAKADSALNEFMARFERRHAIALDPVYTGKMLYGLYDMIEQERFSSGQRIIAIHTGGLQGKRR